jgi:hypothetical protein
MDSGIVELRQSSFSTGSIHNNKAEEEEEEESCLRVALV